MLSTLQQYQQHLVETLRASCDPPSERVLDAFLTVPRHPFVDHYYLHEEGTRNWTRYERDESPEWYEQVYSDQALATRVDQHGRSLSSSSQPTVMATMLDALEIQPGMRVLEVGTGTGYNAALIASLVEDPHLVTTLDIDPDAIYRARQAITQVVGRGMTIEQGDGVKGYRTNAPYDRILVTASSPTVPRDWMEQLAPNGIVVCVLQPGFAMLGGLLKAQKTAEMLKGKIFGPATFMVLRDTIYTKRSIQIGFRAPLYASFPLDPTLFPPHLIRENSDFAFFLYYDIPDLYVFQKKEDLFFSTEMFPQGYVVFRQPPASQVELRGDHSCACALWNRLVRAYSLWLHCGRPAITQYHFEMDNDSQSLSVPTPFGVVWPFVTNSQR